MSRCPTCLRPDRAADFRTPTTEARIKELGKGGAPDTNSPEQAFHRGIVGESFGDLEATAVADEHYYLRCGMSPCRCTCRACLIRSLRYCEDEHLTEPKTGNTARPVTERDTEKGGVAE